MNTTCPACSAVIEIDDATHSALAGHTNFQYTSDRLPWADSAGKIVHAECVRLSGESVLIRKEGREFSIPFSCLAPESIGKLASQPTGETDSFPPPPPPAHKIS